jgi:Dihydrofolate reductase
MRCLRYNVAASLDGYIADANGAFDWILHDETVDFAGLFARVDTIVLGDGEIWLFGGGQLFGSLLSAGQVDAVEVTIVPVLLGQGVPLVASVIDRTPLELTHSHVYPTGMVALHYAVPAPPANKTEGS